jgi:citrate lyase subunit beta/citryl-CoA lyase
MIRSFLFATASNPRHVAKAIDGPSDALIIDLEDAVAIEEKPAARSAIAGLVAGGRTKPLYVRVNGLATPFGFDDLQAVGVAGPDGIILPKVEAPSDLITVDWMLGALEVRNGRPRGSIDVIPIIETARGLAAVHSIAGAVPRVRRLAFGAVDLALDMDLDLSDEVGAMNHPRFALALASRAKGLDGPLDTAFIAIQDLDGLRVSTLNAKKMGYGGKCCIHPSQVEIVNELFTPSSAEIERARRLVAAFAEAERAGSAAFKFDGVMIDYPVVDKARRLLRDFEGCPNVRGTSGGTQDRTAAPA